MPREKIIKHGANIIDLIKLPNYMINLKRSTLNKLKRLILDKTQTYKILNIDITLSSILLPNYQQNSKLIRSIDSRRRCLVI